MPIRVIHWATGPVGSVQLAEVIDNLGFDRVGLFVYSPDKVGVDAGTLVGRPDTGSIATSDKAAILALDADVVLHSASEAYGSDGNTTRSSRFSAPVVRRGNPEVAWRYLQTAVAVHQQAQMVHG